LEIEFKKKKKKKSGHTFTKQGDAIRISAKCFDVGLHPLHYSALIKQTQVEVSVVSVQPPQSAEAIIARYDEGIRLSSQKLSIVGSAARQARPKATSCKQKIPNLKLHRTV
jgi:hypothetical protein